MRFPKRFFLVRGPSHCMDKMLDKFSGVWLQLTQYFLTGGFWNKFAIGSCVQPLILAVFLVFSGRDVGHYFANLTMDHITED